MSTLLEIESAVTTLPDAEQRSLLAWLQERLRPVEKPKAPENDAIRLLRQLQEEVALTPEQAEAWLKQVHRERRL